MSILFENNASGTNSIAVAGATPGPEDLLITLQANEGDLFPPVTTAGGDVFYATLEDITGNIEIVLVTNNVADVLTVTRAHENTVSIDFATGSKVEQRTTAATLDALLQLTGGTMTGALDMDGNDLQDAVLTSTGTAAILGVPLQAPDAGTANEITIGNGGADPQIGGFKIWHENNDGPASGLNADQLDGLEGVAYIKPADDPVAPTGDWNPSGDWNHSGTVTLDGPVTTTAEGTGGLVKDGGDTVRPIGFNVMPPTEQDISATLSLGVNGYLLHRDGAGACDYTLPNDADIPIGATYVVVNETEGAALFRIKGATGVTVTYFDQYNLAVDPIISVVAGNGFSLADAAVVTVYKYTDTEYFLWGGGITESV